MDCGHSASTPLMENSLSPESVPLSACGVYCMAGGIALGKSHHPLTVQHPCLRMSPEDMDKSQRVVYDGLDLYYTAPTTVSEDRTIFNVEGSASRKKHGEVNRKGP